ncbi:MAG TPA: hypothetical protein VEH28_07445 [Thermoplasmata archaeon]|nr:hypothetical protein [Thermoplasmata archaeon]
MLLGHGEFVLRSAYAVADPGDGSAALPKGPGVLYVTNQRVVFEARAARRGLGRRSTGETETQLEVPLHELRNVSVRRARVGRPRLVLELAHGRPLFDVLEPDVWTGTIAQAKRAFPPPIGPFGTTVHTIERQVVKVRCRFCGALGNEVDGRCPTCGAPL